jgi:hypothetical protein
MEEKEEYINVIEVILFYLAIPLILTFLSIFLLLHFIPPQPDELNWQVIFPLTTYCGWIISITMTFF